MSPALTPLEQQIADVLRSANGEALSLRQIEERLIAKGLGPFPPFSVRDAVWRLIREGRADFTPRRYVKAIGA